uniref:Phorbol-ester/DAG-type domain-containing protein n=1 Tax=Sphaeramia orbicularis TaxID=375764 RepID=A0A672ZJU2_9TELE
MDSDSDSPFNYSWPSFPRMRIQSIRESQASSPTLAAAARLSAMIHGKDRVYANAMLVDQVSTNKNTKWCLCIEVVINCFCVCFNSPSLECDSGEDDILGHSYPSSSFKQQSSLRSSSGEERDSFDTSPDFNRSHSESTHTSSKVLLRFAINILFYILIEDEEWDKYIIPSKVESEKYKVSRTFSFLKSRMSSTRNKTKVKGKEVKEGKEKSGAANGHQFAPVSPSGPALCVACEKSISGKELLQCSNCFLNVHKGCRESVAVCGKVPSGFSLCLFNSAADAIEAPLMSDLSADLLGLDAESWSLAVSPEFCRKHDRYTIKRQDVIYGEMICQGP